MPTRIDNLVKVSIDRWHILYDTYDHVLVNISGGKDSTCMMETAALAAKERGIVPVVQFFDEEVIYPETIAYLERLAKRTDIDLCYYCIPITENNAWSKEHPYWYPWAPEAKSLWIRDMPVFALTSVQGYDPDVQRVSLEFLKHFIAAASIPQSTVTVIGRRLAESPARRALATRLGWLQKADASKHRYSAIASPIIDWSNQDVWQAIIEREWDWNRAYVTLHKAGITRIQLRIGPLFGEEPSVNLHFMRKIMPDFWNKACLRVPGASDLSRYAHTALMGRGKLKVDGCVTSDAIVRHVNELPAKKRKTAIKSMKDQIRKSLRYGMPIQGKDIFKTSIRGDSKGARVAASRNMVTQIKARKAGHYETGTVKNRADQVRFLRQASEKNSPSDR